MGLDLDTLEDGQSEHSIFAPSYSHTWLHCAGALAASQGRPDTAGIDAARGTVFHTLMERWITSGRRPSMLGEVHPISAGGNVFEIEVDEEMFDHAADCMAWIEHLNGDKYVEQRVLFDDLTPIRGQGGTCDLAYCTPGFLRLRDWKYGKGVQVFAPHNPQLLLYAYGFFREWDWLYDFQTIEIGIGQPRLDHYQTWSLSRGELLAFAEDVRVKAAAAWAPDPPRTPSPGACQWCKARTDCPAIIARLDAMALDAFADLDEVEDEITAPQMLAVQEKIDHGASFSPIDPTVLSTAQLARLVPYRRMFERWFADASEELLARAMRGEQVPGFKLAESRSRRTWKSDADGEFLMEQAGVNEDLIFVRSIVSPAEAERLVRHATGMKLKSAKVLVSEATKRPPGKPTLAPDRDTRPALEDPADVFDDLDDLDTL